MAEVYQISSTEKVQQLQQELAAQLAELKAEIEDNRILHGVLSRAYRILPQDPDTGFTLPRHSTETEELKPQLQLLLSHFGIDYSLKDLKNSADEMELFSLVVQKFRSIFCKQQTMRTFPVYDAEVSRPENWGVLDPAKALKKKGNWIPFLKIKPKVDPWQQKLLIKLKQWKKVDKLMDLHSKFVELHRFS